MRWRCRYRTWRIGCWRSTGGRYARSTAMSCAQSTQLRARILIATNVLREATAACRSSASVEIAKVRAPAGYRSAIDEITQCLAQQPLHRRTNYRVRRRATHFCTTIRSCMTTSCVDAAGARRRIDLKPVVAHRLARLAGLLRPAREIMWVDDVRFRRWRSSTACCSATAWCRRDRIRPSMSVWWRRAAGFIAGNRPACRRGRAQANREAGYQLPAGMA